MGKRSLIHYNIQMASEAARRRDMMRIAQRSCVPTYTYARAYRHIILL